jgi:phosphate acetyltransferase
VNKKIVFPESENISVVKAARKAAEKGLCEPVLLSGESSLTEAANMVKSGAADTMIAGIDYSSLDVILAAKNIIGVSGKTFSSIILLELPNEKIIISDVATCKRPSAEQLADIVMLANDSATKLLGEPKVAMLSFSTFGSGGSDASIDLIRQAVTFIHNKRPDIEIDGEMQLDAAVNKAIAKKKMPQSNVAGNANVLICPDINSANILYKGIVQFAGAKAYGPILLGFNKILSDLSRGSTEDDVLGTISTLVKLI